MLVAGQLALSLVLLVGAGLMARAFIQMRSVPLGFDPSRAVTMRVELQGQRFDVYDRQQKFDSEASKLKRLAF